MLPFEGQAGRQCVPRVAEPTHVDLSGAVSDGSAFGRSRRLGAFGSRREAVDEAAAAFGKAKPIGRGRRGE